MDGGFIPPHCCDVFFVFVFVILQRVGKNEALTPFRLLKLSYTVGGPSAAPVD